MTYKNTKPMSKEEKAFSLELFKAHYTAKEATEFFPFCYHTIRNIWRGYEITEVKRYDRMDLVIGGRLANGNTK
jgi:hypothetical protein